MHRNLSLSIYMTSLVFEVSRRMVVLGVDHESVLFRGLITSLWSYYNLSVYKATKLTELCQDSCRETLQGHDRVRKRPPYGLYWICKLPR